MNLNYFTDYSLRVLIYLAIKGERATTQEIAKAFKISPNHLVKVAHRLSGLRLIRSTKGRFGGIELGLSPEKINIGAVVELIEPMVLVECFSKEENTCPIAGVCDLEVILHRAQQSFLNELKRITLADLMKSRWALQKRKRLELMNTSVKR